MRNMHKSGMTLEKCAFLSESSNVDTNFAFKIYMYYSPYLDASWCEFALAKDVVCEVVDEG